MREAFLLADDQGCQVRKDREGDEDENHADDVVREERFQIPDQSQGTQQDENETSGQHPPLDRRKPLGGQNDETEKEG